MVPTPVSSLFQEVGKGFGVADDRVACEAQRLERSLGGGLVTAATGIGDNHRNEAQVRGVAGGRLDPNFCCDPDNGDRRDSTIAQGDRKRRSFVCVRSRLPCLTSPTVWPLDKM